jgi:N-acyl homoserine lactone hydrolase
MKINDYDIDIVVQGFPGKSVCHGGLGWSSVVLLRAHDRIVLIDTGGFSMRAMLIKRFAERGLKPTDITDLLLTHSHHDHSVNWTMFPKARIVIGANELEWSLKEPWGIGPVPELYVRELNTWPTVHKAADGEEVFPSITAHLAPGHTPGCMVFVLHAGERDVIFAGDVAKNRAKMVSGTTDMTYDAASARRRSRRSGNYGASGRAVFWCRATMCR